MLDENDKEYSQHRRNLDLKLEFNKTKAFTGSYAYTCSTIIFFTCYLDVLVMGMGGLLYVYSLYIVRQTPKMLILRSFKDEHVDTFLRLALGGFGIIVRPIWLRDTDLNSNRMRRNIPGAVLYVTRIVAWLIILPAIVFVKPGNLPYELIWIGWIVVGSMVFHRYQAGNSASYWLSFSASAIIIAIFRDFLRENVFYSADSSWWDALQIVIWFFITFLLLSFAMERFNFSKKLFSALYFRNFVRNTRELNQFKNEISEKIYWKKFIPTASVGVVEIQSSHTLWKNIVSYSIEECSILLIDITDINHASSLAWELSQAYKSKAAVFFTCEESSMEISRRVISTIGYEKSAIFTWKVSDEGRFGNHGVCFDEKNLTSMFFDYIDARIKSAKEHNVGTAA